MILPKVRDCRFVTIRRGGTLTDSDHHLLALWAASCAEHGLSDYVVGIDSRLAGATSPGHRPRLRPRRYRFAGAFQRRRSGRGPPTPWLLSVSPLAAMHAGARVLTATIARRRWPGFVVPVSLARPAVFAFGDNFQDELADGPSGLALFDEGEQVLKAEVSPGLQVDVQLSRTHQVIDTVEQLV